MNIISVEFKCKKCGKIFHQREDHRELTPDVVLMKILNDPNNLTDRICLHLCSPDNFGVAELVGAKIQNDDIPRARFI